MGKRREMGRQWPVLSGTITELSRLVGLHLLMSWRPRMALLPGSPSRRRCFGAMVLLAGLCVATALQGQEPAPRTPGDSPKSPTDSNKSAPHSLDGAKLPPGAVIVVTDKPA